MMIRKKDGKSYRSVVKEEHVVIIEEPKSKYMTHLTPTSGRGNSIAEVIRDFLSEENIDISKLAVKGCDGTTINTGRKNGAMAQLEVYLKKPLQRFVCLLHTNELPLRHIIGEIDGKSTGPTTFAGPIGMAVKNCENMAVQRFKPIPVTWTEDIVIEKLTSDQNYLLHICKAVSTGDCDAGLAERHPGKLHHARWLTAANRILRLYIATSTPSETLQTFVQYIMNVYAPIWFNIKRNPSCVEGGRHLWKLLSASRCMELKYRKIIDPVLQRNAWFAHPENLLLSMISDDNPDIRTLGWRRILKARTSYSPNAIREFTVPEINVNAANYVDMIDWFKCKLTEPPLTRHLNLKQIQDNIKSASYPGEDITCFPVHTQAVERYVKLVTEVAASVCGKEERHKFILATLKSRCHIPKFSTKVEYKTTP